MLDQITVLERQLMGIENDKKQVLVRLWFRFFRKKNSLFLAKEKMGMTKSSEARLVDEKRQLKRALDECEARAIELEMHKRALEGEIQRLNMILTDKDTEIQVHQERCDTLIKQIQVRAAFSFRTNTEILFLGPRRTMSIAATQCRPCCYDFGQSGRRRIKFEDSRSIIESNTLSNELSSCWSSAETRRSSRCCPKQWSRSSRPSRQTRTITVNSRTITDQTHNESFRRSQVGELKKQNHDLLERVHHLQNEVTDLDMRRHELENQLRNANIVSAEKDRIDVNWTRSSSSSLFNVKKANKKSFKRFRFSLPTNKPCKRRTLSYNDNWAISIWKNGKLNARNYVWRKTRMSWRKLSTRSVTQAPVYRVDISRSFSSGRTWTCSDGGHHSFVGSSRIRSTIPSTGRRESIVATPSRTTPSSSQWIRTPTSPTVRVWDKENLDDLLCLSSLIDFTTRNRRETEAETERIRSSQTAAERALEAREKAHRARVKGLEEQVRLATRRSCWSSGLWLVSLSA